MKLRFQSCLPTVGNLVFLSVFLGLMFLGNSHTLLGDTDTGIHIRAGEVIIRTLAIPKYDIFSFHSPAPRWITHEWLSEVIMALVHRVFGLTGIVIFFALIISATYYLLFNILRKDNSNTLLCAFIVFLVIASSTLHWLARPHIFSLLFILVYHHILDTFQYRNRNYLYVLPLLMLVWVNLHGGFIVGMILIGVYLVGNLIRIPFTLKIERPPLRDKALGLTFALLGCFLFSLINPYGYHILLFPFEKIADTYIMDHATEFLSPNFHSTLPFRYLLFLTIAIFALSLSRADVIEVALVLLFTHMALYSARYIPLFAIVVAPILVKYAQPLLENNDGRLVEFFKKRAANVAAVDASLNGHLWTVGSFVLISLALLTGKIHFRFDEEANPVAAIEFLKRENLKGNMFNNETFGDYVIYTAWPQYKVFADGRLDDAYGSALVREYVKVVFLDPDWEKILTKYNISWVFESANARLSTLLLERQDWRLIYADKVANIFIRNTPENKDIIAKYNDVKPLPPNGDLQEFNSK